MPAVTIELAGGLDLLFGNKKSLSLELPASPLTMRAVIALLQKHHLRERPELFVQGESVRPGILVLINEVDWELESQLEAEVKDGCVAGGKHGAAPFRSFLHTGPILNKITPLNPTPPSLQRHGVLHFHASRGLACAEGGGGGGGGWALRAPARPRLLLHNLPGTANLRHPLWLVVTTPPSAVRGTPAFASSM
jgi:ubiquitin related modifier 1